MVAPVGTVVFIEVAPQVVAAAGVPLNFTVPAPWVDPKFVPVIVTTAPTAPEVGDKLVMLGAATTVKFTPLLALPPTVTTTLPVVARSAPSPQSTSHSNWRSSSLSWY